MAEKKPTVGEILDSLELLLCDRQDGTFEIGVAPLRVLMEIARDRERQLAVMARRKAILMGKDPHDA